MTAGEVAAIRSGTCSRRRQLSRGRVTPASAGICEFFSRLRLEVPFKAVAVEFQPQDAKCFGIGDFAVGVVILGQWQETEKSEMIFSACAYNQLSNSVLWIKTTIGVLRSECFVIVIVS